LTSHLDRGRDHAAGAARGFASIARLRALSIWEAIFVATLPERASIAWQKREGPVVLATVDARGEPNAIYATCVSQPDAEHLLVADNYFGKTRANIERGSRGALLFLTQGGEAFQVKGLLQRHTGGPYYEGMKRWLDPELPGHAAVVLAVEEVYCGSEKLR
jgi:hypothetical protein